MTYPCLLLGVGEPVADLLQSAARLLGTYEPDLLPIVRIGWVIKGNLQAVLNIEGERERANGEGESEREDVWTYGSVEGWTGKSPEALNTLSMSDALAHWLEDLVTERNLEAVRQQGIPVGVPGGHLFVRVLLLVDGEASEDLLPTLRALQEATEHLRQPLPTRLTCMALTTGSARGRLGFPMGKWLREIQSDHLEVVNRVLIDRFRSDGSSLGKEEVNLALPVLLFTALLPTSTEEHWFFQSPTMASQQPLTYGLGLMIVPLPEIEEALSYALSADLLQLLMEHPDMHMQPDHFLAPFRLQETFEEANCWLYLLLGLQVDAHYEQSGTPFNIEIEKGQIKLELSERHCKDWDRLIADYNVKWGRVRAQQWLEQMRENARLHMQTLESSITQILDAAVREGKGFFSLTRELLNRIRTLLKEEWRCDDPTLKIGIPDPDLTVPQKELQTALKEMPNGWAVGARAMLWMLIEAYTAFALARAFWNTAEFLPWVIGGVGLLLMLFTGWRAASLWHEAYHRVLRARDAYLQAIAIKYESILRSESILILRGLKKRLLARLSMLDEQLERLEKQVQGTVRDAQTQAEEFAPHPSPLIRPVVSTWAELSLVAQNLWGGRELKPLLQAMLAYTPITTYADLWAHLQTALSPEALKPQAQSPEALIHAALQVLKKKLMGKELRKLGYYLHLRFQEPERLREWLRGQIKDLHAQAGRVLWSEPKGGPLVWQLLPLEDPDLHNLARHSHPEKAEPLIVPGVLGTLCRQEAASEDVSA